MKTPRARRVVRFVRDERGAALVEFAMISVVLMILIFGIIDFGRALYTKNSLTNAAREGGRYAAVANRFRDALTKWYGAERAKNVKYAEAFEICEYGRRPDAAEIRKLFPFFD